MQAETRAGIWSGLLKISLVSLLIGLVVATAEERKLLTALDMDGYDLLVKWQKSEPPSRDILFVDFDEETVATYSAFPLPRTLLAGAISEISQGNPKVIGLDVLLDMPRSEVEDSTLEEAIASSGKVIIVSEDGFKNHPPSTPLPRFENGAENVAYADLYLEENNDSIRTMFVEPSKGRFPFPVALATYYSGKHLRKDRNHNFYFGDTRIPLAANNPPLAWIHFHPSPPVSVISAQTLLKKQIDTAIFRDKIVLIGQSSEWGRDLLPTPVTRAGVWMGKRSQLSGTEILAAATDTILTGDYLETLTEYPRWAIGLLLAFLVVACGYWLRWFISVGAWAILAVGVFGCALYFFTFKHLWMPFISIEICLALALPAGLGYRSVEERRLKRLMEAERGQLMGLFERYVSPEVAAEIWNRREEIVLSGEERVATIFFSDIRGFTAMTCGVPSQQVLSWLNRYLAAMGEVIKRNGGFLNKFMGDGIMVVFGVPLSDGPKEDASRAVRCALEMLERIQDWNAHLPQGEAEIRIGIGIHTGLVTAGNVGSPERLEYSVIGEAVNLASRLEYLTKEFHVPIVISPATWEQVSGEFATIHLGETQVRGFSEAIPLYSIDVRSTSEVRS